MKNCVDIFIPSYHRPTNIKTAKYFCKIGWEPSKIHVFIDSEADDSIEYAEECKRLGVNLHIFDMQEARRRYDYVHRPSKSRRSAGQARNMFQDYAIDKGIGFYVVIDDDTQSYSVRFFGTSEKAATFEVLNNTFNATREMMKKHRIGLFGLPQTGDFIGNVKSRIFARKVMNTTFYLMPYVYRGERGVQDDDTSLFCGVINEGLFTGQFDCGLVLHQTPSAKNKGGLTNLYNECKLYNKAMVVPLQFPSAVRAERQKNNGGRLHHRINYRYLAPKILKIKGHNSNLAWDTYPEDVPFTNEPKRTQNE